MLHGPHLVDAHVHFYGCYERDLFFDSALANLRRGARELGVAPEPAGWLLFTESANDHFFRAFQAAAGNGADGRWTFGPTEEDCSLIACRDGEAALILVAGRQIVTGEGLEVLALCRNAEFPDGRSLADTVRAVRDSGAVAVVPWGFGKWWFHRGSVLSRLLNTVERGEVLLGDNGRRPAVAPRPRLFAVAESMHLPVLPGSDSFPFAGQARMVAGYGFVVEGEVEPGRPAEGMKRLLTALDAQPRRFGRLERGGAFLANQLMIQARKREIGRWH